MSMYDLPSRGLRDEQLKPPMVSMANFLRVMEHSVSSVAAEELEQFIKWTADFGQEG